MAVSCSLSLLKHNRNLSLLGATILHRKKCMHGMLPGWFGRAVHEDAKAAVLSSADRYVGLLRGTLKRHWNS